MDLVSHHERGVKSESEMPYYLIFGGLILIFLEKFRRAREGDLRNVFLHLVGRHADAVIDEFERLFVGICDHLYIRLIIIGELILSDHVELFKLRNRVAAV